MNKDLCYIVIVHFDSYNDTSVCINSILESINQNFHIVIVNNNFLTESFKKIKKTYNEHNKVSLININSNKGYSFGLNKGIKYAIKFPNCVYLWMLNNDTYIEKNSLNELIYEEQRCNVDAIIGSKILNQNKSIQSLGCKLNKLTMVTSHNYKNYTNTLKEYNIDRIDYIHGCSIFFKKHIIDIVGFFDERYFLFYEDVDYSLRAKSKNIHLLVAQKSVIIHNENSSLKKTNFEYLSTVNRILASKKFFKKYIYFVYIQLILDIFKNFLLFRIKRNAQIIRFLLS